MSKYFSIPSGALPARRKHTLLNPTDADIRKWGQQQDTRELIKEQQSILRALIKIHGEQALADYCSENGIDVKSLQYLPSDQQLKWLLKINAILMGNQ